MKTAKLIALSCLIRMLCCFAQDDPPRYNLLGKIEPRHARDIASSNWSIGGETMDRDYTVYEN
jgi:hypothetical protein